MLDDFKVFMSKLSTFTGPTTQILLFYFTALEVDAYFGEGAVKRFSKNILGGEREEKSQQIYGNP